MKTRWRRRENSQVAAVSLDAFGGAVTLSVGGVTHASVAVTPARWNIEYTRCHVKNMLSSNT